MKKRKIFDVEKVGFGDEPVLVPNPHSQHIKTSRPVPVFQPVVKKPVSSPSVGSSFKRQEQSVPQPIINKAAPRKDKQSPDSKKERFQSAEYISPISGSRAKPPRSLLLAHGEFQVGGIVEDVLPKAPSAAPEPVVDDFVGGLIMGELGKLEPQASESVAEAEVMEKTASLFYETPGFDLLEGDPNGVREVLSRPGFIFHESPLYLGLGVTAKQDPVYLDLLDSGHLLMENGSSSVRQDFLGTVLASFFFKAAPEDARLLLLSLEGRLPVSLDGSPHLAAPVLTSPKEAMVALAWAVSELENRQAFLAGHGLKTAAEYNSSRHELGIEDARLPLLFVVIAGLPALLGTDPQTGSLLESLLSQGHQAGIHVLGMADPARQLFYAKYRRHFPAAIKGDEHLELELPGQEPRPFTGLRFQEAEAMRVMTNLKKNQPLSYLIDDDLSQLAAQLPERQDPLLASALRYFIERGQASASSLQTRMRIGYNRAARLVEIMEGHGWIGPLEETTKIRKVYLDQPGFEQLFGKDGV